jgi:hypothetical protein
MKNYWRIRKSLNDRCVVATKLPFSRDLDGRVFTLKEGRKVLANIPNPLEICLERLEGGCPRHFMTGAGIVIISDLLLRAFEAAGVDNFEVFPIILKDKVSERSWSNYYAFNEIGLFDAALLEECRYHVLSEREDISIGLWPMYAFDKVVLSVKKLKREPKMFRLVHNPAEQLYISSAVREVLKEQTPLGKWGILFSEVEVK